MNALRNNVELTKLAITLLVHSFVCAKKATKKSTAFVKLGVEVLAGSFHFTCKTPTKDIDECSSPVACGHNAKCTNNEGSFTCECEKGYSGNGQLCSDINECLTEYCFQTCINTIGSWESVKFFSSKRKFVNEPVTFDAGKKYCKCNSGWVEQINSEYDKCTAVDECAESTHNCPVG